MKTIYLVSLLTFIGIVFLHIDGHSQASVFKNDNWEKAGYTGTIPYISTNIINVKNSGAIGDGVTNDYNAIQTAINNSSPPAVIYFPQGTYRINSQLNLKSGVVLRGDGYKLTHLEFDSNNGCIQANGSLSGSFVAITGGLKKGSTRIKVSNVSNFQVGAGGYIRQGNVIETTLTSWVEPRSPGQMIRILGIKNDTLIFEPSLNFDYESNPPINPGYAPEICAVRFIEQVGIEDLHIKRIHSDAVNAGSNINITRAANSWIRRIESEYTLKYHISVAQSLNLEIRDNYIHRARSRGNGGQGYGVSLGYQTTSALIENNIFYECRHSMIIQLGVTGCVFGYNYAERNFSDDGWDKTYISLHGHYVNANLFEGNVVGFIGIGDYWGPDGPDNTFFRNRILGTDRHSGFGDYRGIMYADFHGPQYIIGNEITGGSIYYSAVENSKSNPNLVLIHGNNIKGVITWDPNITDHTLPSSLYLTSIPAFFGVVNWPPFGGDNQIGTGTIPALERWKNGNYIPLKIYSSKEKETFSVFPNPTTGNVNILIDIPDKPYSLEILSEDGRILFTNKYNSSPNDKLHKINLSGYPSGIYFIRIITKNQAKTQKLVLK